MRLTMSHLPLTRWGELTSKIPKILLLGLMQLLISFLILTYGRWEYLTWQHRQEFLPLIEAGVAEGCLALERPQQLKVMAYTRGQATIFVQGPSDSKYLIFFNRVFPHSWSFVETNADGSKTCHTEVLDSTLGGSAEMGWYWY